MAEGLILPIEMTVRDALQAWVDGIIATDKAMRLSDATSIIDLYDLAVSYKVDMIKIQRIEGETDEEFVKRFLAFHKVLCSMLQETES